MKIKELRISAQNLEKQFDFYAKKIGLTVLDQSDDMVSFRIGESVLTFEKHNDFYPYHFALNIPSNQEKEALNWLKERVAILSDEGNEIQDFYNWNAKAIYFYDADRNIVEFIARKNLKNEAHEDFGASSLLEVSEIGMPVTDIKGTYTKLNTLSNLKIYDGGFGKFCAIGDEHGLFICIDKKAKGWYPTDDKAHSSRFEILFKDKDVEFAFEFLEGEIGKVDRNQ